MGEKIKPRGEFTFHVVQGPEKFASLKSTGMDSIQVITFSSSKRPEPPGVKCSRNIKISLKTTAEVKSDANHKEITASFWRREFFWPLDIDRTHYFLLLRFFHVFSLLTVHCFLFTVYRSLFSTRMFYVIEQKPIQAIK